MVASNALILLTCLGSSQKRKRSDADTGDEGEPTANGLTVNGLESSDDDERSEEEGEEYRAPKVKKTSASPDKVKTKPKGAPAPKRPRTAKGPTVPKPVGTGARRGRKPKATGDAFDADKVAKEAKINNDNALFSMYGSHLSRIQSR